MENRERVILSRGAGAEQQSPGLVLAARRCRRARPIRARSTRVRERERVRVRSPRRCRSGSHGHGCSTDEEFFIVPVPVPLPVPDLPPEIPGRQRSFRRLLSHPFRARARARARVRETRHESLIGSPEKSSHIPWIRAPVAGNIGPRRKELRAGRQGPRAASPFSTDRVGSAVACGTFAFLPEALTSEPPHLAAGG